MRDIEHEVSDAGRGLWDTIRDNPIPAGMVGVGLAWLMANGATSGSRSDVDYRTYPRQRPLGYGTGPVRPTGYAAGTGAAAAGGYVDYDEEQSRTEEAKERLSEAAGSAKERAEEATDRVREKARDTADEVRDRASDLKHRASEEMHEMRDRAGSSVRQAGYRARRAERRVEHAVEDNPLAAGAIAAALGFAAGMMIPESRREQEMFGPARDRMVDTAERKIRSAGNKAREAAKDTASEVARRTVDEVTGGGEGRERSTVSEPGR